jgi:putative hydrolase of HD superfamily
MTTTHADGIIRDVFHLVKLALAFGRVERGVSHSDGKPETDTDHSVSLAWLACSLAQLWYPGLDRGLIAQLAVVHDAPEVYAGDTYAVTAAEEEKKAKTEREHAAVKQITDELKSLSWLPTMIMFYELQNSPEARFVRAVDKLMPKIVLRHEGKIGVRLGSHGVTTEIARAFRAREAAEMSQYAADFPEVLALREELNTMIQLEDEMDA